jgi:hypothetical protein
VAVEGGSAWHKRPHPPSLRSGTFSREGREKEDA